MTMEPQGCFLVVVDGAKAGTGTAISYGRFGWIGMILVHPSQRRLGLGTELLRTTIAYLQDKGVDCIKLDATPMGKQVYIPLGFQDEYEVQRYERKSRPEKNAKKFFVPLDSNVLGITAESMMDIVAFDADYFGAVRNLALQEPWLSNKEHAYCIRNEQGIAGYIMAHHGHNAVQIGPWLAKDAAVAEKLLTTVMDAFPDRTLLLDLPCPNGEGIKLMEKYGFQIQRGFYRMYLGENPFPGNPQEIYATSGPEKG
jgi:hypothetical protein